MVMLHSDPLPTHSPCTAVVCNNKATSALGRYRKKTDEYYKTESEQMKCEDCVAIPEGGTRFEHE